MVSGSMPVQALAVPVGHHPLKSRQKWAMLLALSALLLAMLMPFSTNVAKAEWSAPRTVFIPETGHTLDQLFLDLWRENDGASTYGYPISKEWTDENGHIIQYLQYARFEYWPEGNADGVKMFAANIGQELRPLSIQRSVAPFSNSSGKSSAEVNAEARAWLPVQNSATTTLSGGRYIEETQHTVRLGFRDFWEANGEADFIGNPLTEEYSIAGVTYQVFERGQLARSATEETHMVAIGQVLADKYKIDQKPVEQGDIPTYDEALFIPPVPQVGSWDPNGGPVSIDIDLSNFYMQVFQDGNIVLDSVINTGAPGLETPTGTFYITVKYEADDMQGADYFVPAVPWVMYFTNQGHALHGAPWATGWGYQASHGCVNLPVGIAEYLYMIAPVGTRVDVHY